MSRIRESAARRLRFARSLSRGLSRGDFFPPDSRRAPGEAPLGSESSTISASFLRRVRGEASWFQRTRHRIAIPGLTKPIRVLHITDVHIKGRTAWLQSLCEALQQEEADLVAITGDVVTKGWTEPAVDEFLSALPRAPLGAVAVMGNWEHWSGADPARWSQICDRHGVTLLMNGWTQRGELVVSGTDDHLAGEADPEAALSGVPDEAPVLMLTHSPGFFEVVQHHPVHLVLSGHSHGGQVRLPLLGALWVPKGTDERVAGWYEEGGRSLFVSRGIGWSIAPIRLWCPPELATIELVPA